MVQRIADVLDWYHLEHGSALPMLGGGRRVRIEVNSPDDVRLYLEHGEGELAFLALVRGRDTIEFYAPEDDFRLMADGADCYILTADGQTVHSVIEAPESFTRIMERRPRNHELERITHDMYHNMNRRLDAQTRDIERRYDERIAALQQKPAYAPPPGGAGSEPKPDGDGNAPDPQAPGADPGAKPAK